MVDRCQYHACNGNDGSFLATTPRDIFIFDFVVGLTGAFDGCMSCLHKHRLDVDTGTCNPHRFLLAGGLIVAGGQAGPTAKPLGRVELRHIRTNFGKDRYGRFALHTGDCAKETDGSGVGSRHLIEFFIDGLYRSIQVFHMLSNLQHAELLLLCELKSFDGCNDSNSLLFERALEQRCAMLCLWIFVCQQIIGDLTGRFPEHIGDDRIQGDVADRKAVLEVVLLAAAHIDELTAITCKLTQYANLLAGDEAAFDKTEAEQLPDPFGILGIVLVSFHCAHPLRICNHDMQFRREHIEDGNQVFAGGFHANVIAVVFNEPMFEASKIFVERGEAILLVRECPHLGDGYDGGNEKTFVDIDATADGVNDFYVGNPPFMVEERRCLSMPSKNDKSMPMISVRSKRSTYLCLSGRTCTVYYTDLNRRS